MRIKRFFASSQQKVFRYSEIDDIFNQHQDVWELGDYNIRSFIKYLIKDYGLKKYNLSFPNRKEILYSWGTIPIYEVLLHLNSRTYFSHRTAMFLNKLVAKNNNNIYVNTEQQAKIYPNETELEQSSIDLAFNNKVRKSNNYTKHLKFSIYHLNGKFTNNLGVITKNIPDLGHLRYTDTERTLIDITVRPVYAGGVNEVLKAYKKAKSNLSVDKLSDYLNKINHKYPYRQAIGFYLERAGYKENQFKIFKSSEFRYDFYLDYQIKNKEYDENWRIYYPSNL